MATVAAVSGAGDDTLRFYRVMAAIMAVLVIVAFAGQFLAGRSSIYARPLVHVHAVVFMGWTGLFLVQSRFAGRAPLARHRTLGWVSAGWVMLMAVTGTWITLDMVQRGIAPFFFQPQHFVIANPMTLLFFVILVAAAVRLRDESAWHMRLQLCAMAALLGPAFGRLLPSPLLIPYAFEAALLAGLFVPAAGIARDLRREGRVHPAWWWGTAAIVATVPLARLAAFSPLGDALYHWVVAGHPGASVPGLAFPPPPPMP